MAKVDRFPDITIEVIYYKEGVRITPEKENPTELDLLLKRLRQHMYDTFLDWDNKSESEKSGLGRDAKDGLDI